MSNDFCLLSQAQVVQHENKSYNCFNIHLDTNGKNINLLKFERNGNNYVNDNRSIWETNLISLKRKKCEVFLSRIKNGFYKIVGAFENVSLYAYCL